MPFSVSVGSTKHKGSTVWFIFSLNDLDSGALLHSNNIIPIVLFGRIQSSDTFPYEVNVYPIQCDQIGLLFNGISGKFF